MTVSELAEKMDLEVFCAGDPQHEINSAYCGDLLSWVMGRAELDNVWFTIMSNQNVAAVAVMTDLSCIVLTEGVKPDAQLLARAETEGLNLLGTALSTYEAAAAFAKLDTGDGSLCPSAT